MGYAVENSFLFDLLATKLAPNSLSAAHEGTCKGIGEKSSIAKKVNKSTLVFIVGWPQQFSRCNYEVV